MKQQFTLFVAGLFCACFSWAQQPNIDICPPAPAHPAPENFHLGSMGGYLTYDEVLAELDAMALQFPEIFKAKAPVSTFETHEGRPIYYVKISDNPGVYETEPAVLLASLIHSNEPVSVMQTVYFMWYLLENYYSDPEIRYLVDHSELYILPVVNPDGYVSNCVNFPNGGGTRSKNGRPTGGPNPGVDLDRNFGYAWGGAGSSRAGRWCR